MTAFPQTAGAVVSPSDHGYEQARRIWNERFDCRPSAVVYPENTNEVAAAVGYARDSGTPFRVRSGGHNVEGFCVLDDGIVIDMSRMQAMSVSDDGTRATVTPGVLLGDVYERLWQAGVTIPAGVCPDVRIGGHVLGGGVGMLVRSRGMLVDSLVALTMVDAQGNVHEADDQSHPDLMWACRGGGGGNFGIATSFTFATKPVGDITLATMKWDWDGGVGVLDAWQHWIIGADPRVNSRFTLWPRSAGFVMVTALFEGSAEEWREAVKPLTDLHAPREHNVRTMPYIDTVGAFSEKVPSIRAKFVPALSAGPLDGRALRKLERWHRDAPPGVKTGFYGLGGAVQDAHAAQRSAFAHRDSLFCVEYLGHWHDKEDDAENLTWLSGIRQDMHEFMTGGAYVNSPDRDLTDYLHAYYMDNLPRLMEVKRRYDPGDVFRFEQSIPASLSSSGAGAAGLTDGVIASLRDKGLITHQS
jgi:FAD binding domain/Berberine and berberine like